MRKKNKSISIEHGFILGKLSMQSKFFTAYLKLYLKENNKCKISSINHSHILEFYYVKYSKSFNQTEKYIYENKNIIYNNYKNIYNVPISYFNVIKTFFILFKFYIHKSFLFYNLYNIYYLILKYVKLLILNIIHKIS